MTTLISWAAIDDRGTSAVYMASDSRLSWEEYDTWDSGRKIFASEKFPEILGYTGDALFCTQVLSQVISFIDSCAPLARLTELEAKYDYVGELIERAFKSYPTQFCLPNFSILYLTRLGKIWGACTFAWTAQTGWKAKKVRTIPMTWGEVRAIDSFAPVQATAVLFVSDGSGGEKFRSFYNQSAWLAKLPLYSRGIFGAFTDFIESDSDSKTGGKPQIGGLYREFEAKKIGFADGDLRFLYGIHVLPSDYQAEIRWVNRTFENCAPLSGERIAGEQRQPAPYAKTTR